MLVFTDEEVRRTHILGLLLSEVQEPGYVLLEKGKFNIVTSVLKIKFALRIFFLSQTYHHQQQYSTFSRLQACHFSFIGQRTRQDQRMGIM